MDIISMLKHMYKYRLRGIYNDLSKYLINMLKFYGQGIALILGVLVTLVLFLETIITTIDINVYFNYIFSIAIVVGILGYMYSPLTLIIFSNPDIFYLIRSQKLFNKIAWIELIKKNIGMIATVLGIAFFIKSNIDSISYTNILASLLIIPIIANIKFYILNKSNSSKLKIVIILMFLIQALFPNIYLISLEYFISIGMVSLSFKDLNLEKLMPMYEYQYNADRTIKIGISSVNIENSGISSNKRESNSEESYGNTRKSDYFKYKKGLAFFLKDYKSMKNRAVSMNIIFVSLIVVVGVLNIIFEEYRMLLYTILYLIVNSQLKNIFDSNYYILFNKVPLCSSIKNFINETSYFSMAIYTLIHTVSFVLEGSLLNTIPFIILISISSVLTTSYNSKKNLNISIFNLINIVLATIYIILNDKVIAIVLTGLYIYILYRFLYTSINSKLNFT